MFKIQGGTFERKCGLSESTSIDSDGFSAGEVALSINILNQTPVDAAIIKKQTDKDPVLCQVFMYCSNGWPEDAPSSSLQPFFRIRSKLSL